MLPSAGEIRLLLWQPDCNKLLHGVLNFTKDDTPTWNYSALSLVYDRCYNIEPLLWNHKTVKYYITLNANNFLFQQKFPSCHCSTYLNDLAYAWHCIISSKLNIELCHCVPHEDTFSTVTHLPILTQPCILSHKTYSQWSKSLITAKPCLVPAPMLCPDETNHSPAWKCLKCESHFKSKCCEMNVLGYLVFLTLYASLVYMCAAANNSFKSSLWSEWYPSIKPTLNQHY